MCLHLTQPIAFAKDKRIDPAGHRTSQITTCSTAATWKMTCAARSARKLWPGADQFSPFYIRILSGSYNDGIPQGSRASLEDMAWMQESA